jgi:hypothetical protein
MKLGPFDLFSNCSICGRPLHGYGETSDHVDSILAYTIPLVCGLSISVCWFCVFEENAAKRQERLDFVK